MKDPSDSIRTWLYGKLNGLISYSGSAVPVYSFAPKDQAMPYILLAGQSAASELAESTKDCYINRHSFTVEIYSSHTGNDFTYKPINTIADSVMQLLITRSSQTISGYTVVSVVCDSLLTDAINMDNKIIGIKIMNFTMIIVEN